MIRDGRRRGFRIDEGDRSYGEDARLPVYVISPGEQEEKSPADEDGHERF
jgi:hypothetical protein